MFAAQNPACFFCVLYGADIARPHPKRLTIVLFMTCSVVCMGGYSCLLWSLSDGCSIVILFLFWFWWDIKIRSKINYSFVIRKQRGNDCFCIIIKQRILKDTQCRRGVLLQKSMTFTRLLTDFNEAWTSYWFLLFYITGVWNKNTNESLSFKSFTASPA